MALEIKKTPRESGRWYMYIFVRQDIYPEYQLVQAAHVAFKAGLKLKEEQLQLAGNDVIQRLISDRMGVDINYIKDVNLNNLYFRVIGVADDAELLDISWNLCDNQHLLSVSFREPDLEDRLSGLATWPVQHGSPQCDFLYNKYNARLLKFKTEKETD